MNIQKVWDAFIKENDNPSFVKMAYAVVEQLGGVNEDTLLNSLDSCRNANDGYTGFCYPYQTSKFWNENKSAIMENMHELADDLGEDLITMIKGFGNFKDDKSVTYDAIGKALYAPFNEGESRYIYDTFAKYALEEVANRFQDWWYDQDESEFDYPHSHGWGFLLTKDYRIMSDLEKILNDDLLKCEIVNSAENEVRRVDLIKWTHDNTFSIAIVHKDTGKLEVSDIPETDEFEAHRYFYRNYGDAILFG